MRGSPQFQAMAPLTPMVKKLLIINISLWFVGIVILQNFFLAQPFFFQWFGLIPLQTITKFWIWQPFTYMFFHSLNIFHIVFNMLLLWWLGAELEQRWGSRFFLLYYMVTGVGAAIIYVLGTLLYFVLSDNIYPLKVPVIGASGAVFGLMLAYGMIFGERVIYFMMIFPMKAKYFVMILGGIEVVSLLTSGPGGEVANLAHLGGIVAGFLFLWFWARKKERQKKAFKA